VVTLTFDLLTLKVMSESRVMWATSMPILIFLVWLQINRVNVTIDAIND